MTRKGSGIKAGQHYAAAYNGKNGDLIIGRVKSVRVQGEVVLTNLLNGHTSTKKSDVLLVRNRRVTKAQAEEIVKFYRSIYKATKSKDKARQAARQAAVKMTRKEAAAKKPAKSEQRYSQLCSAADDAIRKKCGWTGLAWVGVNWQRPRTRTEERALQIVKERFPNGVTVHVYELVDLIDDILTGAL